MGPFLRFTACISSMRPKISGVMTFGENLDADKEGYMSDNKSEDSMTTLPLLPLRDVVVYPHMVIPLFVGRSKSIAALEKAMADDKQVLLVAQKTPSVDEPN